MQLSMALNPAVSRVALEEHAKEHFDFTVFYRQILISPRVDSCEGCLLAHQGKLANNPLILHMEKMLEGKDAGGIFSLTK